MSTDKWTYNRAEEGYWSNDHFDTRREAIEAGREEYPSEDFYIGQCNPIDFIPYLYIDAEHAIDALSGQIDDNYGGNDFEFGQSFYDEAMEQHDSLQAKLDKAVKEWLSENEFCKECFTIRGVELIYGRPECYTPEQNNVYPLCIGNGSTECIQCNLWTKFDCRNAADA